MRKVPNCKTGRAKWEVVTLWGSTFRISHSIHYRVMDKGTAMERQKDANVGRLLRMGSLRMELGWERW